MAEGLAELAEARREAAAAGPGLADSVAHAKNCPTEDLPQGRAGPAGLAGKIPPLLAILLVAAATRTSLAAAHAETTLILALLFLAGTLVLVAVARAPDRRPGHKAVVAALAGACFVAVVASPGAVRQSLTNLPALAAVMALLVLAHLTFAAGRSIEAFSPDDRSGERWVKVASEFLPPGFVRLAAAELAVIHMALFRWGGKPDIPPDSNGFAYHKHLAPMSVTLLLISVVEVGIYHLFVGHWSRTAALIMFVVSDLSLIYLVGLIKSFRYRPVLVTPAGIRIRAGFLIDQFIPNHLIRSVDADVLASDIRDPQTLNAALLAWPNILIKLETPLPRRPRLRRRPPFSKVGLRLDDPAPFLKLVRARCNL